MGRVASGVTTTDMEVTSIRMERSLKEQLKEVAGQQGYQSLIRNILWHYINTQAGKSRAIVSYTSSTSNMDLTCVLSGKPIPLNTEFYSCLTLSGDYVPVSKDHTFA